MGNSSAPKAATIAADVDTGDYGILRGYLLNQTRWGYSKCEPGYFCVHGMKYQCKEGRYGTAYGLFNATCSGVCQAGFRCPSYGYNDYAVTLLFDNKHGNLNPAVLSAGSGATVNTARSSAAGSTGHTGVGGDPLASTVKGRGVAG